MKKIDIESPYDCLKLDGIYYHYKNKDKIYGSAIYLRIWIFLSDIIYFNTYLPIIPKVEERK